MTYWFYIALAFIEVIIKHKEVITFPLVNVEHIEVITVFLVGHIGK